MKFFECLSEFGISLGHQWSNIRRKVLHHASVLDIFFFSIFFTLFSDVL